MSRCDGVPSQVTAAEAAGCGGGASTAHILFRIWWLSKLWHLGTFTSCHLFSAITAGKWLSLSTDFPFSLRFPSSVH